MTIYSLDIHDSDFRDYMEGHEMLDALTDDDYVLVTRAIIDRAGEPKGKFYTEFGLWFIGTSYWDDVWDVLQHAIDDYIDIVTLPVLKELEG